MCYASNELLNKTSPRICIYNKTDFSLIYYFTSWFHSYNHTNMFCKFISSKFQNINWLCHGVCINGLIHNLLTALQSGLIQGNSTTYYLIHIYLSFCEAVDNDKEVRTVFVTPLKLSTVGHRGLLHKLSGIQRWDNSVHVFSSYLLERKQRAL